MTTLEALIKAKSLIDRPEKWCQHSYQDDDGRRCSIGALRMAIFGHVYDMNELIWGSPDMGLWLNAYTTLIAGFGRPVFRLNDTSTHAEVMEAWNRAIALVQAAEPQTVLERELVLV